MGKFHSFADISRIEEDRGFNGGADEVRDWARKGGEFSFIDRGLLIRIATVLERMEGFFRVACEPMAAGALESRARRLVAVWDGFDNAFTRWMDEEEVKHGPCPPAVHGKLRRTAACYWRQYVPSERVWFARSKSQGPYLPYSRKIPGTLSWRLAPTDPPCGPRTKTRREWEVWQKRRVRRKKSNESG